MRLAQFPIADRRWIDACQLGFQIVSLCQALPLRTILLLLLLLLRCVLLPLLFGPRSLSEYSIVND